MAAYKELLQLTQKILTYLDTLSEKYNEVKETGVKGDFYSEVKPFADEVKEVNDAWKKEAVIWVEKENPKKIYNLQINSTYENVEIASVQAFFPESSLSRFNSAVVSARFVLNHIVELLSKK